MNPDYFKELHSGSYQEEDDLDHYVSPKLLSYVDDRKVLSRVYGDTNISLEKKFFEVFSHRDEISELELALRLKIAAVPLEDIFFLWIREKVKCDQQKLVDRFLELIDKKLLDLKNIRNTFAHARSWNFELYVDLIRSSEAWTIERKEELVEAYIDFCNHFFLFSQQYGGRFKDPDRELVKNKILSFEKFIKLLLQLKLRDQCIAKLFYFGPPKNIEEIFSLEVRNLNFLEKKIEYSSGSISYPFHVFNDLKKYISDRSTGFVFVGKQGNKLAISVPYRAIKNAIEKLGIPAFSFKMLTDTL